MPKIVKIVDGQERIYEVGRNYLIGENVKGNKGYYKLLHKSDGFFSTIFFQSNNFFHDKELKNIGTLSYDFEKDIVTYRKYGYKPADHEFHKTDSIGLNWEIISNMCPKDLIKVISTQDKKKIVYSISVSKALKFQDFKYFKNLGYEKQIFIPACEFKAKEFEIKRKRRGK